jgi:hypothetical protein
MSEQKERWRELCEQAQAEENSDKLLALVSEINTLLAEKEEQRRGSAA